MAICERGEEVATVRRVAHGARGDRAGSASPRGLGIVRRRSRRPARRGRSPRLRAAAAVDPVAQPGDPEQSLQLGDLPVLDVGHQEPRRVRSQVNRARPGPPSRTEEADGHAKRAHRLVPRVDQQAQPFERVVQALDAQSGVWRHAPAAPPGESPARPGRRPANERSAVPAHAASWTRGGRFRRRGSPIHTEGSPTTRSHATTSHQSIAPSYQPGPLW